MIIHAKNKFQTPCLLCRPVLVADQSVLECVHNKIRAKLDIERSINSIFRCLSAFLDFPEALYGYIFYLCNFLAFLLVGKKTKPVQGIIINWIWSIYRSFCFFWFICICLFSLLASGIHCGSIWHPLGKYREIHANYGKVNFYFSASGAPL